jgi:hypothetical protein
MKTYVSISPTAVFAPLIVTLLMPACTSEGWDPTANMDRSGEERFIARADGPVDIGTLGKLGKYIRGQRQLNRSEEQILESLASKRIGGYRFERLKVLEQKRASTAKRHETQRAERSSRHQARVKRIETSPAPAAEKARELSSAKAEHEAETKQAETQAKRELVLIDNEIQREKSRTYMVPVNDPKGPKGRSVVLVDASNRIKGSKVYQIDRSVVDLAKVASRDEADVAVLSDVAPLQIPGGY